MLPWDTLYLLGQGAKLQGEGRVLSVFDPKCPKLNLAVSQFVYGPSITARLVASIGDEIALGALPPFLQWIGPRDYDRP
jgi:hypothetical protein